MGKASSLREVLLDAAEKVLAERGPAQLSFREVTRRAGVSHAAPKNHFENKAALMAALADRGAAYLDAAMADAQAVAPAEPFAQFMATGLGYLRFAARRPRLFKLMHSREYCGPDDGGGQRSASWLRLARAVRALREARGLGLDEGEVQRDCLLAWSVVHGIALLQIDAEVPQLLADADLPRALLQRLGDLFR